MKKDTDPTPKRDFLNAYKKVRKPTAPAERVIPDKRDQGEEYDEYEGYKDYEATKSETQAVRARVIVTGKVQGVFFRALATEQAADLGVTGWIRNRADGSVELILEGPKENVQQMIDWCYIGPPAASVDNVEIFWEPATGEFTGFAARHTF